MNPMLLLVQAASALDGFAIAGLVVGVLGLIPVYVIYVERKEKRAARRRREKYEKALIGRIQEERKRIEEGQATRYRGLDSELPEDLIPTGLGSDWAERRAQARITSLTSGKGGVGKSVLALALTEHYSMEERVLLVDFDMHHRGLTSVLLSRIAKEDAVFCDVYGELKRFKKDCLPSSAARPPAASGRFDLNKLCPKDFEDICEKFVFEKLGDGSNAVKRLDALRLPERPARTPGDVKTIGACECYFLPNVRHDEGFLLTDVSRMDISEIFLFLRCLAEWAHTSLGVTRMVIDCGGAHDMFAVGTVLASSHLAIVTTPEPGAIEGTAELVVFARKLVDDKVFMPQSDALVLNQYRVESEECVNEFCELFKGLLARHVDPTRSITPIRIRNSEWLRTLMQDYEFPSLHQCADLWAFVQAIADPREAPAANGGRSTLIPARGGKTDPGARRGRGAEAAGEPDGAEAADVSAPAGAASEARVG